MRENTVNLYHFIKIQAKNLPHMLTEISFIQNSIDIFLLKVSTPSENEYYLTFKLIIYAIVTNSIKKKTLTDNQGFKLTIHD